MKKLTILLAGSLILPVDAATQDFPASPPPAEAVRPADFPPFREGTLANGLKLLVIERHHQPVLSISLTFPAGTVYDPAGKEGTASMAAQLLTKGAGSRSAEEIAATIEGVGGTLEAGVDQDFLTITADVLRPHADLAFELLADAAIRPRFPAEEMELLRTRMLSAYQFALTQPSSVANRAFVREVYGDHPYGRLDSAESIRAVTRDDLLAFQRQHMRPSGALVTVAGDIGFDEAKRLAEQYLGPWRGKAEPAPQGAGLPEAQRTRILLVHRPGSVQSNVQVGNLTFEPTDPRRHALTIANQVLGANVNGRLFNVLREQKGWTYGAYSEVNRPRGVGFFRATVEARNEVTDSAVAELIQQLRRIQMVTVPQEELELAKQAEVGVFPLTVQTAGQIAARVRRNVLIGLPRDELRTYRGKLLAVKPEEVRQAARAAIQPDAAVVVVVGDASRIYDGLARIAPTTVVDVEGRPVNPAAVAGPGGAVEQGTHSPAQ